MTRHPYQRVGVFIDVQNMYYSAKNLYGCKVDFGKVLKEAVGDRQLIRAFAYVIKADIEPEAAFYTALEKIGFETRVKDLQVFSGGAKKGDWDVGICVDMVKMAPRLDAIVLVSGDGDFFDILNYLHVNQGNLIEVIAFGRTTSAKLIEEADTFIDMDKNSDKYLIKDVRRTFTSRAPKIENAPVNPINPVNMT